MRVLLLTLVSIVAFTMSQPGFAGSVKIKRLDYGWTAVAKQADPFDDSKLDIYEITKGSFTFRCNELNMSDGASVFESFSFRANLKYRVDDQAPVDKKGKYSTGLGGSDLVADSRYYSFRLGGPDIKALKAGNIAKVAAQFGSTGWTTKSLNLMGFTAAYNLMCS